MASALLYIRILQQQFKFLLIRIKEAVDWTYTTPNVNLQAEWDIESVIPTVYKELARTFVFMHVKSHQDDDTPVASLSLVEADQLATEYMKDDRT